MIKNIIELVEFKEFRIFIHYIPEYSNVYPEITVYRYVKRGHVDKGKVQLSHKCIY